MNSKKIVNLVHQKTLLRSTLLRYLRRHYRLWWTAKMQVFERTDGDY